MRSCKILALGLLVLLAASCGKNTSIKGTLAGAPGRPLTVKLLDVNVYKTLDTVKTDAAGAFRYALDVKSGQPQFVYLYDGDTKIASLLLQTGDKVVIEADTVTVDGTLKLNANADGAVGIQASFVEAEGALTVNTGAEDTVGILSANGLTASGTVFVDACSGSPNGSLGDGIRCANGSVTVNGDVEIYADRMAIFCSNGGITIDGDTNLYTVCSDVDTSALRSFGGDGISLGGDFNFDGQATVVVETDGPLHFGGVVNVVNEDTFGTGIITTYGGVVFDKNVTIDAQQICVSAGDSSEGIIFGGNVNITNHKSGMYMYPVIDAPAGPVSVAGDLTVKGYGKALILAASLSVEGNVQLTNSLSYTKAKSSMFRYYNFHIFAGIFKWTTSWHHLHIPS